MKPMMLTRAENVNSLSCSLSSPRARRNRMTTDISAPTSMLHRVTTNRIPSGISSGSPKGEIPMGLEISRPVDGPI
jgi:hypothetical protein